MTLHAEDRYNSNPDAADIATGPPDAENGRFEQTGLAHQYMNRTTLGRLPAGGERDLLRPKTLLASRSGV
jgi:hypothetical protein